jgi:hypothetical protein
MRTHIGAHSRKAYYSNVALKQSSVLCRSDVPDRGFRYWSGNLHMCKEISVFLAQSIGCH